MLPFPLASPRLQLHPAVAAASHIIRVSWGWRHTALLCPAPENYRPAAPCKDATSDKVIYTEKEDHP